MNNVDQNVRFAQSAGSDNPYAIINNFKPPRWLFDVIDPIGSTGQDEWFYTNIVSGDLFIKQKSVWEHVYNFNTGPPAPGITNIANDGIGAQWFKTIIGSTAHFKTALSSTGKITFASLVNEVDMTVNIDKTDVGLNNVVNILNNYTAVTDPGVNDGSNVGFSVGSLWMNVAPNPIRFFIARSVVPGSADWDLVGGSGAGITNIVNLAGSAGLFRDITGGSTANFKSLNSTTGKITYVNNANTVDVGVNLIKSDVGLPLVPNRYLNFQSAINPTVNNDASVGFSQSDLWSNYANGNVFMCRTNTVGAAVWSQVAGTFTRTDNDFILCRRAPGNHDTVFSTTGVNVLLNIGFTVYRVLQSRGSWAQLNLGFGPVIIQRTAPTNGIIGNNYLITYMWTGLVANTGGPERSFSFGMNLGNGSSPSAGFIEGSESRVVFVANQFLQSSMSHSFVYTANSAFAENLFIAVNNLTDTSTLTTSDLTVMIQQI